MTHSARTSNALEAISAVGALCWSQTPSYKVFHSVALAYKAMDDDADAHRDLVQFLATHDLSHLIIPLSTSSTLHGYAARNAASRTTFLKHLQGIGIEKLSDRQKFANALGKATRQGSLPKMSTSDILLALGQEEPIGRSAETGEITAVLAPYDVGAQLATAALPTQRIPRIIHQTNKTRRVGIRAWHNVCQMCALNPSYSYRFYDDERCEALIREHFHHDVLTAFRSLRSGAAIADLWRYCCLYVHGGIYLDLDSSIHGPLDASCSDAHAELPIGPTTEHVFYYDAEANLVQWVLMAAPHHPVLLRCIQLSTSRILAREPNIFNATGPSVFTDAFITEHAVRERARAHFGSSSSSSNASAVFSSRTTMSWSARLNFLQRHGAVAEDSATVSRVYRGYSYEDVYEGGESERYLPTWGAEPTHGLYHPLPVSVLRAAAASSFPGMYMPGAAETTGEDLDRDNVVGAYAWSGADTIGCNESGDAASGRQTTRPQWRCVLSLHPPPCQTTVAEEATANVLQASGRAVVLTEITLPYAPARFRLDWERSDRSLVHMEYLGMWRRAPGAHQEREIHLFEWTPDTDVGADEKISVEAPSVMRLTDEAGKGLELVGWHGNQRAEDGLSRRLDVARRRASRMAGAAAQDPVLTLPIVFSREVNPQDAADIRTQNMLQCRQESASLVAPVSVQ